MKAIHCTADKGLNPTLDQLVAGQHLKIIITNNRRLDPGEVAGLPLLLGLGYVPQDDAAASKTPDLCEVITHHLGLHSLKRNKVHKEVHHSTQLFNLPWAQHRERRQFRNLDLAQPARRAVSSREGVAHRLPPVQLGKA